MNVIAVDQWFSKWSTGPQGNARGSVEKSKEKLYKKIGLS